METIKKLSEFMNEVLYGELKLFRYSTQDVIELYCEVRRIEDDLMEKSVTMVKTETLELRLRCFKQLRKMLVDAFATVAKDEAALAKLERWYGKSKKPKEVCALPKVRVIRSSGSMAANKSARLIGLPKSKAFLDINNVLTKEGFWRGNVETTAINEDQLRFFYYVLRLDEDILKLICDNHYVYVNVNDRLHSLVANRSRFIDFFKQHFGGDVEGDFICWKKAVGGVFPQVEKLANAVTGAKTETTIMEAYSKLVKFWNNFNMVEKCNGESRNILNLTGENFPAEYGIVNPEQQIILQQALDRLKQPAADKSNDIKLIREIVREYNCRSVVVDAQAYGCIFNDIRHLLREKIIIATQQADTICLFAKKL